jgi:hypothetical protein
MTIPLYYVYDTALAPSELIAKHPHAATYATITLFVTGASITTGIVNLASMGFNHPFEADATGMTAEQLDAIVDRLLDPVPPATADEVQISKVQANYLYETRFKPEPTAENISQGDLWQSQTITS